MVTMSQPFTFVFFIAFITTMQFILMNMFIAFISTAYTEVNKEHVFKRKPEDELKEKHWFTHLVEFRFKVKKNVFCRRLFYCCCRKARQPH